MFLFSRIVNSGGTLAGVHLNSTGSALLEDCTVENVDGTGIVVGSDTSATLTAEGVGALGTNPAWHTDRAAISKSAFYWSHTVRLNVLRRDV